MKRDIIKIDEDLCTGCGICIPNCHEGALQMIDGKARLVSDLFCDGLGACIGHCPEGAISIEKREAEPYDEKKVMREMIKKGPNTIKAHMKHLKEHNAMEFYNEGLEVLKEEGLEIDLDDTDDKPADRQEDKHEHHQEHAHGFSCPGSKAMQFEKKEETPVSNGNDAPSELRQWPVQMHLISPDAPYFKNSDLVLAADCVAFSMGNFHNRFLKGKSIAIACPKLDHDMEVYLEKLTALISRANINTMIVVMMEVPCCSGMLQLAQMSRRNAGINIPIKKVIVSLQGDVITEEWT